MSRSILRLKSALACGIALGAFMATAASAAPLTFTRPNTVTTAGSTSVSFGGQTFVNQGLQGVARLPATTTKDFAGDTFGAFSGLDILPGSWRRTATGSYTGTLYALPDRGPNGVGSVTFSDYAARINAFTMDFTPYTGTANLPAAASSQQQLKLIQAGGLFLKDFNGNVTTGFDPGAPGINSFITQGGYTLPGSKVGTAAGKISLDAEGLRFLNNGSFYVSDEYGANVYYFNKVGGLQGVITPPPALVPRDAAGNLSYTSLTDATTGRRLNQGLEGLAVTPDNKKLVTLLQSATMQDTNGANQQTRSATRLMVYDITKGATPQNPIGDYVLELPTFRSNGNGAAVDRTAAQSEILALNDTQFLVLARDGNGLGQANLNPVYKSILMVDITGATNLAGTAYETSYTPISPAGVLNSSITPVQQTEIVNILNTTQLTKFGINTNNIAPNSLTLTEKWEGMALVPVLDESAPQDYFLLVGNDNDFLSTTCNVGGQDCSQAVNSDAVVLVYRLTLPTYVDSQYLDSMITTGPLMLTMTTQAARSLVTSPDIAQHLEVMRHDNGVRPAQASMNWSIWGSGGWSSRDESTKTTAARTTNATLGLDAQVTENILVGVAAGLAWGDSDVAGGFGATHWASQFSAYTAFQMDGFFADLTGTYSNLRFNNINRAAAYGLTATGRTNGDGYGINGEAGYLMELGEMQIGPLAGFRAIGTSLDGYSENGASGGNILYPSISRSTVNGFFGGEASTWLMDEMKAVFRVTYNTSDGYDAKNATLTLINAANAMGTQSVVIPGLGQDYIAPSLTLTGTGPFSWYVNYGASIGLDDGLEHHVSGGLKFRM